MALTEPELRKISIPIFFDMMQFEYFSNRGGEVGDVGKQNFDSFKVEVIELLDSYIVDHRMGDDEFKDKFVEEMTGLCEAHTSLRHSGMEFVELVDTLMTYLLEYRSFLSDHSSEGNTSQMMCICNLLDFYLNALPDQEEVYVKYILKLYTLHVDMQNHAEAGYTLLR